MPTSHRKCSIISWPKANPVGPVAQLVRAFDSHSKGRRFESSQVHLNMTARTHDLAGLVGLVWATTRFHLPQMTLATICVALIVNFLGCLIPDLDNASAEIWEQVRGGSILSKIVPSLMGGHRYITHSWLGLAIIGWLMRKLLELTSGVLIVDNQIVWWAFMIGMTSHLIMDSLTKEGVMWLYPLPWHMGFPMKALRIKTDGKIEKLVIFPGLIGLIVYLVWVNQSLFKALVS